MYEANLTVAAVRSCSSISFLSQQWKEIVDVYLQNKWLFNSIYALKTLKSLAPPWATPRAFEHAALWSCGEGSGTNQFSKVQMPYPTAEFDDQMPPYTIWKHIQSIWKFLCITSKHCNVCWDLFGEQIAHKSGVHFLPWTRPCTRNHLYSTKRKGITWHFSFKFPSEVKLKFPTLWKTFRFKCPTPPPGHGRLVKCPGYTGEDVEGSKSSAHYI